MIKLLYLMLLVTSSHGLVAPRLYLVETSGGSDNNGMSASLSSQVAVLSLITAGSSLALASASDEERRRRLTAASLLFLAMDGMMLSVVPSSMGMLLPAMALTGVVYSIPTTTTPSPPLPCPVGETGWSMDGNSCYFFSMTPQTWSEAQTFCQSLNGRLVEIETTAENDFLRSESQTQFGVVESGLWIGGRYRTLAMTYNWESTGGIISPDVLDWEQPNYPMMNECLLIYLANANRKRDLPCTEMQGLICERPA